MAFRALAVISVMTAAVFAIFRHRATHVGSRQRVWPAVIAGVFSLVVLLIYPSFAFILLFAHNDVNVWFGIVNLANLGIILSAVAGTVTGLKERPEEH